MVLLPTCFPPLIKRVSQIPQYGYGFGPVPHVTMHTMIITRIARSCENCYSGDILGIPSKLDFNFAAQQLGMTVAASVTVNGTHSTFSSNQYRPAVLNAVRGDLRSCAQEWSMQPPRTPLFYSSASLDIMAHLAHALRHVNELVSSVVTSPWVTLRVLVCHDAANCLHH